MKRVLMLIPALLAAVPAAPAGAGPTPATSEVAVARSLAPPGSVDDGASLAASSLARLASQDEAGSGDPLPGQRYPWRVPRSSTDRPDERTGRLLHFVYVIPAGMPDDQFDEKGIIEDSARSMNVWTKQQINRQWRLDTFTFTWDDPATPEVEAISVNAVDVTTIKSTKSDDQLDSVSEVEAELVSKGLDVGTKRYLSYVAANAGGVCGDAWWSLDPSAGPMDGQYSDIYLYSSSGCRARDFAQSATQPYFTETIAMQEMIHNDGAVPMSAPHNCVVSPLAYGHVCTGPLWVTPNLDPDSFDVMFPYVGLPLNQKKLDEDRLDYYGHPFPTRDLEQGFYLEAA
jgi:hypothetical protein